MKKAILFYFFFLTCFFANAQNFSTKGNTFWLAYMENLDLLFNGEPSFSVYVFSENSGAGEITAPATGLSIPFTYAANEIQEVMLPPAIYYGEGSEDIENLGLRIDLSTEGYVFALHYRIYFSEATSLLPEPALGDSYVITAVMDANNGLASPSSFVVVATQDNTVVNITPSVLTLGLRPAGIPFSVTLSAGQSYQVQAVGDLSGTFVETGNGEKIAVFGGALKAYVGCGNTADSHCYDQLLPISGAAKTYPIIPFGGQNSSIIKITATEDNTEIFFDQSIMGIINSGEFMEMEIDSPTMLEASKPVFAVQLNPSQDCVSGSVGDPNMLHLAAAEMRGNYLPVQHFDIFEEGGSGLDPQYFITLFTETENISSVLVDGNSVVNEFDPFPNNETYSYAFIEMTPGAYLVESDKGVLAYAYGFGDYDAYTYHLGYESPSGTSAISTPDNSALNISPNPTGDFLWLDNQSNQAVENIQLVDRLGRIVFEKSLLQSENTLRCEVNDLAAGIYFLRYQTNGNWFVEKVVIL